MMRPASRAVQAALPAGFQVYDVCGLSFLKKVFPDDVNAEINGRTDLAVGLKCEIDRTIAESHVHGNGSLGKIFTQWAENLSYYPADWVLATISQLSLALTLHGSKA